jgi:drug/metabolite transporter (DMT)-like permease
LPALRRPPFPPTLSSASQTTRAQLQIHFCVLLWGFTAILGKLISLPALALVVWRMLLVTVVLALVPRVWRGLSRLPRRTLWIYAGIGSIVALHWLTFYGSIKLANASVAATCIALAPVFLAVVEPVVTGKRFEPRELALGIAVVPGVALVVGGVPDGMRLGVAVGALSAFLVAIFGALNKRYIEHSDPLTVTALELGAGALFLLVDWPGGAGAGQSAALAVAARRRLAAVARTRLHPAALRAIAGRAAPALRLQRATGDQP